MKTIQWEQKPIPPHIQRDIERNLRAGRAYMTPLDKYLTALTSFGLFCLGLLALILLALFASGCAAKAHTEPAPEEPIARVLLPGSVPGWYEFCVEDPVLLAWPNDEVIVRRSLGVSCGLTVNDIRQWFAQQRRAD